MYNTQLENYHQIHIVDPAPLLSFSGADVQTLPPSSRPLFPFPANLVNVFACCIQRHLGTGDLLAVAPVRRYGPFCFLVNWAIVPVQYSTKHDAHSVVILIRKTSVAGRFK